MIRPQPKPRRGIAIWMLRAGIALGLMLLLIGAAFIMMNLSFDQPGTPLYTEDDLPRPPSDADNGWALLRDAGRVPWSGLKEARSFVLKATNSATGQTPKQLASEAPTIAPTQEPHVADCISAYERRRFADACPIDITAHCPGLELSACHTLVTFEVLRRLGDDDPTVRGDALELAKNLLRASLDHAATASSLFGQKVAQSNLVTTLDLLLAMRGWLPPEDVQPMVDEVVRFDPDPPPRELALMGEYVRMLDALDRVAAGRDESAPTFMLDVAETRQVIDDAFRRAAAGGELAISDPREEPLWWFDNYAGKVLLTLLMPNAHAWESVKDDIARNEATLATLTGNNDR